MPSYLLFTICSLIWGSTYYAITLQLGDIPPAVSVVYRFALASSVLFALCRLRGHKLWLPWRVQRWTLAQGFLTFGLSYVCTYNAERFVVSALVAVLYALMVFWTPLCARLAFGTPVARRTWSAGAAAMAGVLLLFWHSIVAALHGMDGGRFLLGLGLGTVASFASSAGSVVVGKVRAESGNVMLTTAWSMLWGTGMVALWCVLSGQHFVLPHTASYVSGLLYLAIFGSVVAFLCYFTLISRMGSSKAVYITVITPPLSVLLSVRLEDYQPGALEWIGMAICLGSVAWAVLGPRTGPAAHAAAHAPVRVPSRAAATPSINLSTAVETP